MKKNRACGGSNNTKKNNKLKNRESDYMSCVLTVQIAVCIAVIAMAFALMKAGGEKYDRLREEIGYIMGKDITFGDAVDALSNALGFVVSPSGVWKQEAQSVYQNEAQTSDENEIYSGSGGVDLYEAPAENSFSPVAVTKKGLCPVKNGTLTSGFGYRKHPIYKTFGFHTGLDIAAKENSDIYCVFDGTVEETGYNESFGNYIIIRHGSGVVTKYCHCNEIIASKGAKLRGGEVIAKVGSTGVSTGPHLHLEVSINGTRYNPTHFIGKL